MIIRHICTLALTLLATPVFALWSDADRWNVQANIGLQEGKSYERVYVGDVRVSELTWDIKNIPTGIITATYTYNPFVRWNFQYWTTLDKGHSKMVDRDWLDADRRLQTHYSIAEYAPLRAEGATISMDLLFKETEAQTLLLSHNHQWSIHMPAIRIFGTLGIKSEDYDWKSYGGYAVYPSGYIPFPKNELGISYRQELDAPFVGLTCEITLPKGTLTLQGTATNQTGIEDYDIHHSRAIAYNDSFEKVRWYTANIQYAYPLLKDLTLHLGYGMDWIPNQRGDIFLIDLSSGSGAFFDNDAGIARRLHHYTIGIKKQF